MAKIQQNIKYQIPFGKYFNDSGKYYIDASCFTSVNIPHNIIEIDADTGEQIRDFKRNSLAVPYKDTTVYISTVKKQLKQINIDKVLILFSSKIAGENYFAGIQKYHFIEILEYLKTKGYLNFDNVNDIYKAIFVKDYDIKMDMKLTAQDRIDIKEKYNPQLKQRFQGIAEHFHLFDDTQKKGLGFSTYERDTATFSKPFIKFYDKRIELLTQHQDFFKTLSSELQTEIKDNFIYRFEFTLKDKSFFTKFAINNRLEDIHEIPQYKWQEVGRRFLNTNFQVKINKPKDTSDLRPIEKVLCLQFLEDRKNGFDIAQIQNKYIAPQKEKTARKRMKQLFERIYYFTTVGKIKEVEEAKELYEVVTKWDKYFGFINNEKQFCNSELQKF